MAGELTKDEFIQQAPLYFRHPITHEIWRNYYKWHNADPDTGIHYDYFPAGTSFLPLQDMQRCPGWVKPLIDEAYDSYLARPKSEENWITEEIIYEAEPYKPETKKEFLKYVEDFRVDLAEKKKLANK